MEYRIVSMESYVCLEQFINKLIKSGWQPIGGVGIKYNPTTNDTMFFQSMIKDMKGFFNKK